MISRQGCELEKQIEKLEIELAKKKRLLKWVQTIVGNAEIKRMAKEK